MIISIERECGCGAHEVAEKLSGKYALALYDKESLIERAKDTGCFDDLKDFFDEHTFNSLLYSVAKNGEVPEFGKKTFDILRTLTEDDGFLLIGRCGNYVYRNHESLVSVFLHGEVPDRIKRTMEKTGLDRWRAGKLIDEVDDRRRSFHKYYTGRQWGYAPDYDLCINTSHTGVEGAAALIEDYIRYKFEGRY